MRKTIAETKRSIQLLQENIRLSKSIIASGNLNKRDVILVTKTIKDVTKIIPFLAILAVPGGSILAPILMKSFPSFLPSTFINPNHHTITTKIKNNNNIIIIKNIFIKQIITSLFDIQSRLNAQAIRDDLLIEQVNNFLLNPTEEALNLGNLYQLDE